MKDEFKKRGYRWNDGTNGRPKSWFIEIPDDAYEDELMFLRREIYRRDVEPFTQRITTFEIQGGLMNSCSCHAVLVTSVTPLITGSPERYAVLLRQCLRNCCSGLTGRLLPCRIVLVYVPQRRSHE